MNFSKYSLSFSRTLRFHSFRKNVRTLFTAETLDLETYTKNRQDASKNVEHPNQFKWELQCYIQNEPEKDVNSLKNAIEVVVHLVQSDNDDIKLVRDALYAYTDLKDVTDIAKRSIGNLVMKALYSTNRPDDAFELYHDPQLSTFFAGFKSTLLCMDLLYINEKFQQIVQIDMEKRQLLWPNPSNFSKFIDVLVFGACYKLNTPESFDYAHKLWTTVKDTSQFKRSLAFVAALALNQSQPITSIEVLRNLDTNFVTEQIKLMALADLSYINEIIQTLSLWSAHEKLSKHNISKDVIERIQKNLKQNPTISGLQQFQSIYDELIQNDRISNKTLEDLLNRPISNRIGFRGKRAITEDNSIHLIS